jgi:hypothetical protein
MFILPLSRFRSKSPIPQSRTIPDLRVRRRPDDDQTIFNDGTYPHHRVTNYQSTTKITIPWSDFARMSFSVEPYAPVRRGTSSARTKVSLPTVSDVGHR